MDLSESTLAGLWYTYLLQVTNHSSIEQRVNFGIRRSRALVQYTCSALQNALFFFLLLKHAAQMYMYVRISAYMYAVPSEHPIPPHCLFFLTSERFGM